MHSTWLLSPRRRSCSRECRENWPQLPRTGGGLTPGWPIAAQDVGLAGVDGVTEAVAQLLGGQRDREVLLTGLRNTGRADRSDDSGNGSTPLIWAASIAMAAAARSWPSSFPAIMPPKKRPIKMGFAGRPAMITPTHNRCFAHAASLRGRPA